MTMKHIRIAALLLTLALLGAPLSAGLEEAAETVGETVAEAAETAVEKTGEAAETAAEKTAETARKVVGSNKTDSKLADGWPQWRGPGRDAHSPDVPEKMPELKLLWKKPVKGEANAGIAANKDLVVIADYEEGKMDYWRAYDAKTGAVKWEHKQVNTQEMDYGPAPRATPILWADKAIVLDAFGNVLALNVKTGKVDWKRSYVKDFGGDVPTWGFSSSPLIADGKLIINPGGMKASVAALDPGTGKTVWMTTGGGVNYSSFTAGKLGGVEQVIGVEAMDMTAWDLDKGKKLWSVFVESNSGYIVPDPVVVDGKLVLNTTDEMLRMWNFKKGGKIDKDSVILNEDVYPEMATPVVWGGGEAILAASEALLLLDMDKKLKTLWIYDREPSITGLVFFIVSKDRAMCFGDDGSFVLLAYDEEEPKQLGKKMISKGTYSHPALVGDRLYAKDRKFLYAYKLVEK